MKAFEAWWEAEQSDEEFELERGGINSIKDYIERLAQVSWRAALEWLRDNEDAHCCGDCDQVGEWSPCPKDAAIKNELEN